MTETFAQQQRARIAGLLHDIGPDAPTLCEGWTTHDLAAHIVIRERRPDSGLGILLPQAAGYTAKVMTEYKKLPFNELVQMVADGPQRFNPISITAVDDLANSIEFFIHAEDIVRAQPRWSAADIGVTTEDMMWKRLNRMAGLLWRKASINVTLHSSRGMIHAKRVKSLDSVTISGKPSELLLFSYGRKQVNVDFTGDAASLELLNETSLSV